jgi:tetratricopeptide (TPR) repeat protein
MIVPIVPFVFASCLLVERQVASATAYMEAGENRQAEAALQSAQRSVAPFTDGIARAELLNAWSALHFKLGRWPAAEAELLEARRIAVTLPQHGDLLPTVLHNLAAIEMRTGRYAEALSHEMEALRRLPSGGDQLIRMQASLASLQYVMGQPGEANQSMEGALALAEKTYGPVHPLVADLLESHAIMLDRLKLKGDARRARERARKIRGSAVPATGSESYLNHVGMQTLLRDRP